MKENILITIQFVILAAVQVLILNHIHIFSFGIFLYVLFVINYPFERNKIYLIVLSFFLGLTIDLFSQSYGIHAFATTLIAYLRPFLIKLYTKSDDREMLKKTYSGFSAVFYRYAATMIFIHHLALFSMEAFSIKYFFPIMSKTLISSILTLIFVFFVQSISTKKVKTKS